MTAAMLLAMIALAAAALAQQPAESPKVELAVLKAGLGACSADFTVTDSDGKPAAAAVIHVKVRYGMMSIKRMDLEVTTNIEGKARVEGLPAKAKPLAYDIQKAGRKAVTEQNLSKNCQATYELSLK